MLLQLVGEIKLNRWNQEFSFEMLCWFHNEFLGRILWATTSNGSGCTKLSSIVDWLSHAAASVNFEPLHLKPPWSLICLNPTYPPPFSVYHFSWLVVVRMHMCVCVCMCVCMCLCDAGCVCWAHCPWISLRLLLSSFFYLSWFKGYFLVFW